MHRKRRRQHITRLEPLTRIDNDNTTTTTIATTTSPAPSPSINNIPSHSPSIASSIVDKSNTTASTTASSPSNSPSIPFINNTTTLPPSTINSTTSPTQSPSNNTTTPSSSPSRGILTVANSTTTTALPSTSPSIDKNITNFPSTSPSITSVFNNNNTNIASIMDTSYTNPTFAGTSLVGGQAFYDNNNDGLRDSTTAINGFANVNVWIYSCNDGSNPQPVAFMRTMSNGIYRFTELAMGKYYIIAQPPSGYQFSDTDDNASSDENNSNGGTLFDGGGSSTIDPKNGRTICFPLEEGEKTMDWSFGLYRPSDRPSAQPTASAAPTIGDSDSPSVGDSDSPSIVSSNAPSRYPSESPTHSPSEGPTTLVPTVDPTARPTTAMPSRTPTLRPTLRPSGKPSLLASNVPSENSTTGNPTSKPTPLELVSLAPPTLRPSMEPIIYEDGNDIITNSPTANNAPLEEPTRGPAMQTTTATTKPLNEPSLRPSSAKRTTFAPTVATVESSLEPSWSPTDIPTGMRFDFDGIPNNNNGGNNNGNDRNSNDMGMIIGIICGLVAFLAVIAAVVYLIVYQQRKKKELYQRQHSIAEVQVPITLFGGGRDGSSVDGKKGTCATSIDFGATSNNTMDNWDEGTTTASASNSPVTGTDQDSLVLKAARDAIRSSNILSRDEVHDEEAGAVPPFKPQQSEPASPRILVNSSSSVSVDTFGSSTLGSLTFYDGTIGSGTHGSGRWSQPSGENFRSNPPQSQISIPAASSKFAAEAERDTIRNLEKEITTLTMALGAYPKHSQAWLLLDGYLQRAKEELEAVKHDIGYNLPKTEDRSSPKKVSHTYAFRNGEKIPPKNTVLPIAEGNEDSDEDKSTSSIDYLPPTHNFDPSRQSPHCETSSDHHSYHYNPRLSPVREGSERSNSPGDDSSRPGRNNSNNNIVASTPPPIALRPGPAPASFPSNSTLVDDERNEQIHSIEEELNTLSTAMESYPKNSQQWLQLQSYTECAREELLALSLCVDIQPHIVIDVIVRRGANLGLVVDKPQRVHGAGEGGVPVYIRNLHPLSPLRHEIELGDKIIAIDDVDVRQFSAVEVGRMLSRNAGGGSSDRKITVLRENDRLAEERQHFQKNKAEQQQQSLASNFGMQQEQGKVKSRAENDRIKRADTVDTRAENGRIKRAGTVPTPASVPSERERDDDQTKNDGQPTKEEFDLSKAKHFLRELKEERNLSEAKHLLKELDDDEAEAKQHLPTETTTDDVLVVAPTVPEKASPSPSGHTDPQLEASLLPQAKDKRSDQPRTSGKVKRQRKLDNLPTHIFLSDKQPLEDIDEVAEDLECGSIQANDEVKVNDEKAVGKNNVKPTKSNAGPLTFADELAKRATATENPSQLVANKATTRKRSKAPTKSFRKNASTKKLRSPTPPGNDFASELARRTASSDQVDEISTPEEGQGSKTDFASMLARRASEVKAAPSPATQQLPIMDNSDSTKAASSNNSTSSKAKKKKKKKKKLTPTQSLRRSSHSGSSNSSGLW